MRIIFDFDYTIFDTDKLYGAVTQVFYKHGLDEEKFLATLEDSREGGREWKPYRQFEILKEEGIPTADSIKRDFESLLLDTDKFMYQDTRSVLENIKGHNLFLLTYGEDVFQGKKTSGSSLIRKHFDKVVITRNLHKDKEARELSGGKTSIFLEDNPGALSAAKKLSPHIITVRINRGDGRYASELSGPEVDYEIKKLSELKAIIKSNESS